MSASGTFGFAVKRVSEACLLACALCPEASEAALFVRGGPTWPRGDAGIVLGSLNGIAKLSANDFKASANQVSQRSSKIILQSTV